MNKWWYLMPIILGYLSGSLQFGRYLPMLIQKKDVTVLSDDGNPGTANVFKHCGIPLGVLCLILELAKGFLPVWFALIFLGIHSWLFTIVMLSPVLGHAFSAFHRLRGGKCIAVSFGVFLAMLFITPVGLFLAAIFVFFCTVIRLKPNTRKSIVSYALFAPVAFVFEFCFRRFSVGIGAVLISVTVILKHWMSLFAGEPLLSSYPKRSS